jgi:hypothetical protein
MKKTTLGLGLGALVLGLGVISASSGTALAYRGDPVVKDPDYSVERHEAMTKAFENKDYDAWKSLMAGRGRVVQVVNKDNFAEFAEAHALMRQGKTAEAQKIRQKLGLGLHGSEKAPGEMGMGRGMNR